MAGWINPETGNWDDNWHAQQEALEGGGGGGGTSVESILNNAIASFTSLIPKAPKPYDEVNPFFFDETLAREASTAEYSPYYNEKLSDYVSDIESTKSRSTTDLSKTLNFLSAEKESFTGAKRRVLDQALRTTNQGYAGNGLYFSGARERDVRELGQAYNQDINDYTRGYEYKTDSTNTGYQRQMEDLAKQETRYTRDINREKDYAIESGVLQRKGEVRDEYEISRDKYYDDYWGGVS